MATLCLDAGTSQTKCVAFADGTGDVLAQASADTRVLQPRPAAREQDMHSVLAAVREVVHRAAAGLREPVTALAVTAQGDGLWLVGQDGRPTGTAVLWNDARAAPLAQRWQDEGRFDAAWRVNGCSGNAGLPHVLLAHLREHEPQRLVGAQRALTCGGWVFSWLTGHADIDVSDAGNPWCDVSTRRYSLDLLELFGLGWAAPLLPDVRGDGRRVEPLRPAAADELGLPAGLPVVLAPYDVVATAAGVGATRPGLGCAILGTTLCALTPVQAVRLDVAPVGMHLATTAPTAAASPATTAPAGPAPWLRAVATLSGTEVLGWACGLLGLAGPAELTALAATVPQRDDGPVLLPYLSPAGERGPFADRRASGSMLGLGLSTGRAELARAVFEGLTFVLRECVEALGAPVAELRLAGGGAASHFWCQLLADVTGVPVQRAAQRQSGALGALAHAEVALGRRPDLGVAVAAVVRPGPGYVPDADAAARYEVAYRRVVTVRDEARAHLWPLLDDPGVGARPNQEDP